MKKIQYCCLYLMAILWTTGCSVDNYDEPNETLTGKIVEKGTGKAFQTEAGDDGVRLKLLEYSWSDNPTPYYFTCMQDGTFNNTKIFKGNYNINPQGAFVPLLLKDSKGNVTKDETVTVDIKGRIEQTFEVEPFLKLEWVGQPVINSDNTVTVTVKVVRGTTHADYQQKVTDLCLFVSPNTYVGNKNKLTNMTQETKVGNGILGVDTQIKTKIALGANRSYFIRVGARIDKEIDGIKRFNYTEVKEVKIP